MRQSRLADPPYPAIECPAHHKRARRECQPLVDTRIRTPETPRKRRIYKEVHCRAGRRKAKPGLRGLLQCQVEETEQRDCGGVHKNHTGNSASHRMLQYIGKLRLPAEDPCTEYEVLPGVYLERVRHDRQPRIARKHLCDGRGKA